MLLAAVAIASTLQGCISLWGSGDAAARRMAAALDLRPGMNVGEVGAGTGQVTVATARLVGPAGHVYSTELDPALVERIRSAAGDAGLANVTVIQASATDSGLPPDCCNRIFMIGVYHHLTDPAAIDASLFKALRPGGELAVADFPPTLLLKPWTPEGIPANRGGHGISQEIVTEELGRVGFRLERRVDDWPQGWFLKNYCLVFRKPAASAEGSASSAP